MSTIQSRRPKFQIQKVVADFTRKIPVVIDSTACFKHEAQKGEPCWIAPYGVCDSRARGVFDGTASERNRASARAAERAQKVNRA